MSAAIHSDNVEWFADDDEQAKGLQTDREAVQSSVQAVQLSEECGGAVQWRGPGDVEAIGCLCLPGTFRGHQLELRWGLVQRRYRGQEDAPCHFRTCSTARCVWSGEQMGGRRIEKKIGFMHNSLNTTNKLRNSPDLGLASTESEKSLVSFATWWYWSLVNFIEIWRTGTFCVLQPTPICSFYPVSAQL